MRIDSTMTDSVGLESSLVAGLRVRPTPARAFERFQAFVDLAKDGVVAGQALAQVGQGR